ncbi:nicotinate phosphoribosyltransferase, partial [Candidatus Epulonipiscium fishelsonii]
MVKKNLTLLTDLYQLTMMQGYYQNNSTQTVVFEMFYRKNPSQNGFAIFAGLHQFIDYINNIVFDADSLEYLSSLNIFSSDFLEYLKNFKFTGDIYSIPEGTIIFPEEPLFRVIAPILEAQFIESTMLNIINHQSLIATKASRVISAADGDTVLEFGLRRAQGPDASLYGTRAAIIGGCVATSNVLAGKEFNVAVSGTQAHSWIMSFESELDAFRKYADLFPNKCLLLVDTYDTLNSGIP